MCIFSRQRRYVSNMLQLQVYVIFENIIFKISETTTSTNFYFKLNI